MGAFLPTVVTVIVIVLIIGFLVYPAYIAFKNIRKK